MEKHTPMEKPPSRGFSRKTTRVTMESPNKPFKTGRSSKSSHVDLSLAVSRFPSRATKLKAFDPEEDYNFDSTDDEAETTGRQTTGRQTKLSERTPRYRDNGAIVYQKMCKKYGKVAINNVMKQFGRSVISLDGFNLSHKELKAFFVALVESYVNRDWADEIEDEDYELNDLRQLSLGGNRLGGREIDYLVEFVNSHVPLVNVTLSGCRLCSHGVRKLASYIRVNKTLKKLDLSENNLTDNSSEYIKDIVEYGENIKELILRRNKLGECGISIGEALVSNDTLTTLDLSWNHIRGKGAIGLCKGLKENKGLETLNLSWNGFGFDGSVAMAMALSENTTLNSLDLSNNRIHPPALLELLKFLDRNKTLSTLKLSHNPITANMTSIMLTKLLACKENNIKELDMEGVVVDKEFGPLLKQIQDNRLFIVRYDMALPLNKGPVTAIDPKNIFNIDPIRILYYMKEHLRTIDLFLKVDKDRDNHLSKEEMQYAFEMEGFPISKTALDQVMSYLDTNKDGEVDLLSLQDKLEIEVQLISECIDDDKLREFIDGERRLKRQLIKEHEEEILNEREADQKFSQTFTANKSPRKLPPLNGPKMT